MGKKKRQDRQFERSSEQPHQPLWRRVLTWVSASAIGIFGLVYTYQSTGADELRAKVYQPLYAELVRVEELLQSASAERVPNLKDFSEIRQTGAFERIPSPLRRRLQNVFEEEPKIHVAVLAVNELIVREMSSRIIQIRTEEQDRAWLEKTSRTLREMSTSEKGISDSVMLFRNAKHAARSPSIDMRDPNKPVISGPGGPTFVINDWLGYPESIKAIEDLWKDIDYLYFHETKDMWYYRLTREDLNRANMPLSEFLKPVHEILRRNTDFQLLLNQRSVLLSEISDLKVALVDRIRDPKQLYDLIPR